MKLFYRLVFAFLALVTFGHVAMLADDDAVTTAVTTATGKIDQVATIGVKAYLIAAGLALLGVTVAYIRRAKK